MQFKDRSLNLFFPTPVWTAVLDGHEALNARIRQQLTDLDWDALQRDNVEEFEADHTLREDRFITVDQVPATRDVLNGCLTLCREIADNTKWNLDGAELRIIDYWYHVTDSGNFTQTHTHKPALLSGVYYVDKPENSGHLVFIDENPYHAYMPRVRSHESEPLLAAEATVGALEGAMIIFPSWLQHRVKRNESGKRRVSISFNVVAAPAGAPG